MDSAAALSLVGIPRDPWEELESYTCDAYGTMHIKWLGSSENTDDVCEYRASGPKGSSAYGHSHPHFVYPRDKHVSCLGDRVSSFAVAYDANERNKKFSFGDKRRARSLSKPMYLVVPERDLVKVYREGPGRWGGVRWRVEIVVR